MVILPLKAWRPVSDEAASRIACPPYDVISTEEARSLADGNSLSFLHVIRPEIGFPAETDEHEDAVYDAGATALKALMAREEFIQEDDPAYYVYQLEMQGKTSTGLFAGVRAEDYRNYKIVRHEDTRPDKEDDRTRHIVTQRAHAEPVMLVHPDDEEVDHFLVEATREPALLELTHEGVTHRIWPVKATPDITRIYQKLPAFYVADGHHRCAAASRAALELEDELPAAAVFPAVIFSAGQMNIMAYNRVVFKADMGEIARWLNQADIIGKDQETPSKPGEVCVYTMGQWFTLRLNEPASGANSAEQLDVQLLQDQVLAPVFGIIDPRTDANIAFVGGIRGTSELVRLVDGGVARIAFSMYPTSVRELMEVSDDGLLMPPKSTWFEPKLRSGLLVHVFG